MPIFGVDVSKHQGADLDWPRIKASGIEFMIARASLATTPDPMYPANVSRARKAGIAVVGAYHFLYPANVVSPVEQAQLFVQRIGNAAGLLTVLDVEKDRSPSGTVHEPGMTDVQAFATEFARLTGGHTLILYAPAWYWTGTIGDPRVAQLGPLHASRYVPVVKNAAGAAIRMSPQEAFAKVPSTWWKASHGGWTSATILQFTSSGKVDGYGGPVDVNAFQGSIDDLAAFTGAAAAAVPPPEVSPPLMVPDSAADAPANDFPQFYTVVPGDTLIQIAARNGFVGQGGMPGFKVLIDAFPENAQYAPHPGLINSGDQVRVR